MNTNSTKHENDNEALVSAALDGDRAAFADVCRIYTPRLFHTVYQIVRNREDAEDALQDGFMRAFVHLRTFDGRAQFATWLTRIAINSALMILRKRKNHAEVSIDFDPQDEERFSSWEIADAADDQERRLLKSEAEEWVRRAVDNLHRTLRIPIELRIVQELSNKEGARLLKISPAAYKSRLARAKVALREEFTTVSGTLNAVQQASQNTPDSLSRCVR
ncbi:MAG: sigma-70 family RNA polymerase sigma factor [Acidobacteriaceae bacterium]|jgi:RNA polymerase sigma factor (sigma-70 family)